MKNKNLNLTSGKLVRLFVSPARWDCISYPSCRHDQLWKVSLRGQNAEKRHWSFTVVCGYVCCIREKTTRGVDIRNPFRPSSHSHGFNFTCSRRISSHARRPKHTNSPLTKIEGVLQYSQSCKQFRRRHVSDVSFFRANCCYCREKLSTT